MRTDASSRMDGAMRSRMVSAVRFVPAITDTDAPNTAAVSPSSTASMCHRVRRVVLVATGSAIGHRYQHQPALLAGRLSRRVEPLAARTTHVRPVQRRLGGTDLRAVATGEHDR